MKLSTIFLLLSSASAHPQNCYELADEVKRMAVAINPTDAGEKAYKRYLEKCLAEDLEEALDKLQGKRVDVASLQELFNKGDELPYCKTDAECPTDIVGRAYDCARIELYWIDIYGNEENAYQFHHICVEKETCGLIEPLEDGKLFIECSGFKLMAASAMTFAAAMLANF